MHGTWARAIRLDHFFCQALPENPNNMISFCKSTFRSQHTSRLARVRARWGSRSRRVSARGRASRLVSSIAPRAARPATRVPAQTRAPVPDPGRAKTDPHPSVVPRRPPRRRLALHAAAAARVAPHAHPRGGTHAPRVTRAIDPPRARLSRSPNGSIGRPGPSLRSPARIQTRRPAPPLRLPRVSLARADVPPPPPDPARSQVSGMLFVVAVVFILGAVCLGASNSVDEVRRRYDDDPACFAGFFPTDAEANRRRSDAGAGVTCELTLTPKRTLKAPVYVYYEMRNVLQNHRRFVKSRSDDQLAGRPHDAIGFCEPKAYVVNDTDGTKSEVNPCGLMAWSTFNDTYAFEVDGVEVPVNATGIAWRSDVEEKFADYAPANVNDDPSTRGGRAIGPSVSRDERFIVWMRTAALPKFRKLWGRIERDIPAGATVRGAFTTCGTRTRLEGPNRSCCRRRRFWAGRMRFWAAYLAVGDVVRAGERGVPVLSLQTPETRRDMSELSWQKTSGVSARVNAY